MTTKDTSLVCSFCTKGQNEVKKLIAGPTVYICDECVDLCNDILAEEYEGVPQPESPVPRCSSCGTIQERTRILLRGNIITGFYICSDCVALAVRWLEIRLQEAEKQLLEKSKTG